MQPDMGDKQLEEIRTRARELYADRRGGRRLLRCLSDKRLRRFKDPDLYHVKGLALRRMGRRIRKASRQRTKLLLEAVAAFTAATELSPKDPSHFRERATAYRLLGQCHLAFKDYDAAVLLAPKDSLNYTARANAWRYYRKFKKAKEDYATAIRFRPKDPAAFYERRWLWRRLKDKSNEIKDFSRALELDPKAPAHHYVALGDLYHDNKDYRMAFQQYSRALDLDPSVELWSVDYVLVNILGALVSLTDVWLKRIFEACGPISYLINEIRDLTDPSIVGGYENIDKPVVHFTKLLVADILLSSDDNKLRFYHVSQMNDPQEGKVLLQILDDPVIEGAFTAGSRNEDSNYYLGSFLPDTHADELVMWRTYGKDEQGSEAKGCSIVIERDFFENEAAETPASQEGRREPGPEKPGNRDKEPAPRIPYDTRLHKVIYYDATERKVLGSDANEITKALRRLRAMLGRLIATFKRPATAHARINRAIDSIVYYVITELQYYFKAADYSYEKEERVILFAPPKSPLVKIEGGPTLPKRLYIEAKKPIRKYIHKVVLGPRVVHPERWCYLKAQMIKAEHEIEVVKSEVKFQ